MMAGQLAGRERVVRLLQLINIHWHTLFQWHNRIIIYFRHNLSYTHSLHSEYDWNKLFDYISQDVRIYGFSQRPALSVCRLSH